MPKIINQKTENVEAGRLKLHPMNARQGDVGHIYQSILANGFFGFLVVQRSTRHILVGNHRYQAAVQAGLSEVPVLWVDVDDDRALRILLADNKSSDRASYDETMLAATLADLHQNSDEELEGTGWDGDELDDIIKQLEREEKKAATADDDNEPARGKKPEQLVVMVPCADENEQAHIYERLNQMGWSPVKTLMTSTMSAAPGSGKRGRKQG